MKTLFIFLISITCLSAQKNSLIKSLDWSPEHKISDDFRLQKIIPFDEGYYTIRMADDAKAVFIGEYDEQCNLSQEVGFSPSSRGENWKYVDMIWLNNQFYLLSSFFDEENKQNKLFKQPVIKYEEKLRVGKLEEISKIPTLSKYDNGTFEMIKSEDDDVLLIYNRIPNPSEKEVVNLQFYSTDFQEAWRKSIVMPYSKEHFEIIDKQLDDSGDLFLLGRLYEKGRVQRRRGLPNYVYTMVIYKSETTKPSVHHLTAGEALITDLKFKVQNSQTVTLAGLISDNKNTETHGICYYKVDVKQEKITQQKITLFKQTPIRLPNAQPVSQQEVKLPRYLNLDHLFLRSDGGVLMIAERSFQVSKYTYQDDDILVVNVRPDGAIQWVTQIPKKQTSFYTEDDFLSYFPVLVQDKIYLIYNDDGRNFSYNKQRRRLQRHKTVKGFSSLTEIQKDGNWKAFPLSENSVADLVIHPKVCRQVGNKTILLYEAFGNSYRFGKLVLK